MRLLTPVNFVLLFLVICLAFGCSRQVKNEVTAEEAEDIVDAIAEIWNEGNLDLVDEFYSPGYVLRYVDIFEDKVGIDAYKKWITDNRASLSGFTVTREGEIITHADKIVLRWIAEGIKRGKKLRFMGVSIMRVKDGKVVEEWRYYNHASLLRQQGYTITPPAPPSPEKK
jgi:predicted ester cyclase